VNIIHRDIKPGSILIATFDVLKMADFKLAQFLPGSLVLARSLAGTLEYMSPEMIDGQPYSIPFPSSRLFSFVPLL
jgi:serine/threonine protein kinase